MRNTMYRLAFVSFFLMMTVPLPAQHSLLGGLLGLGLENVSSGKSVSGYWVTFEDRVHRNTYQGIAEVVRLVVDDPLLDRDVSLIVLSNGVPQIKVMISGKQLSDCRTGLISIGDVYRTLQISYDTDDYRKETPPSTESRSGRMQNRSSGKVDLVLYPQVSLANYRLDVLYVVSLSLAPALEMQLWKGARLTGQVILPVYNNLSGEVDYVRPGILALSQFFRLHDNVFGRVSAGNFNADRMGVDAELGYVSRRGRWGISATGGYTGSSTFYGGEWRVSRWNRVNIAVNTFYYEPTYNLQFDLSLGQYVYGDRGGRVDCTRRFGEVSVGFFAMYSGGSANGGFHLAVPLPGRHRKRSARFPVRVMLPSHFDWEYQAQSGREYTERKLGRSYETRPDENRSSRCYHPDYIMWNLKRIER